MGKHIYNRRCFYALLALLVTLSPLSLFGQQRCSTMEYQSYRRDLNPGLESDEVFENWMGQRVLARKVLSVGAKKNAGIVTIPVVVHIIHNGEPAGQGSNISEAQVISQIEVLNEDFRRLNSDAGETLPAFQAAADDMEIEFTLARQDPEGLPTNGIVRVKGNQPDFGLNEAAKLSALSYWPAEDYLNIWVANLASNLLGFAQFPVSSLEGLEDASNNRLTDGLVLRYQSFGSNTKGSFPSLIAPFDLGRTTTHEMGHFFGLRHIWGDGNCSVDDYCTDTPTSSSEHEGCNLERESCGQLSMVQNYMDYTDDVCMNLFTTDQKERMRIVLENSPRRKSLTTSPGAIDPIQVADDLGVRKILSPLQGQCETAFTPSIEIRNYGTNEITSAEVAMSVNGSVVETANISLSLSPLDIQVVSFTPPAGVSAGSNDISFEVLSTNGQTDNNASNNIKSLNYIVNDNHVLSINETFEIFPPDWVIVNPDAGATWQLQSVPGVTGGDNQAMMVSYFDYQNGFGEIDRLISPPLDLSEALSASLSFRFAYANRSNKLDRLTVAVSTDCGNNFENIIFDEVGDDLATAGTVESAFVPEDKFAWKTVTLNLDQYLGDSDVLITFNGQNGQGNNLYLDDIMVVAAQQYDIDLGIEKVVSPTTISCENTIAPSVLVENHGRVTVSNFTAQYSIDGVQQANIEGLTLDPGSQLTVEFPEITVEDGDYNFEFLLTNPPGQTDQNPDNNAVFVLQRTDNSKVEIPLREKFEDSPENNDWWIFNPDQDKTWVTGPADGNGSNNNAIFINGYDYENTGQEDWLISPVLDLSDADEASMTFKFSYANASNYNDRFRIFISENCGSTFDDLIYVKQGASLGITASNESWSPTTESDWKTEFINLNPYTGNEQVRVAFVFENQFGNNLYLDDIEFFVTSDTNFPTPETNTFVIYPNPVAGDNFNTTFNLFEKEDIYLTLIDSKGQVVYDKILQGTLNQTYTLELPQLPNGVYFVKVTGNSLNNVQKLLLQK